MKIVAAFLLALAACVAASAQSTPKTSDEVARISVDDARAAFNEGSAVFVDARTDDAYRDSHIKGAINIPYATADDKSFSTLPKGKRIIVYCS